MRFAELFKPLRGAFAARDQSLDLGDLLVRDLQTDSHDGWRALTGIAGLLVDSPDEGHFAGQRIGHEEPVGPFGGHCSPEPVARFEALPVFGEFNISREWNQLRIMRHEGVQIAIDEALETGLVAWFLARRDAAEN